MGPGEANAVELDKTIVFGKEDGTSPVEGDDASKLAAETFRLERERAAANDAIARLQALQQDAQKRVEELTAGGSGDGGSGSAPLPEAPVSPSRAAAAPTLKTIAEETEDDFSRRLSAGTAASDLDKTIISTQEVVPSSREEIAAQARVTAAVAAPPEGLPTREDLPTQMELDQPEAKSPSARESSIPQPPPKQATEVSAQEEMRLQEALAMLKRDNQQLSQDISKAKHEDMMRREELEGALDETKRMIKDHLDQTQMTRGSEEITLAKLRHAAALAKQRATTSKAKLQTLEKTCNDLKAEVLQAEKDSTMQAEDAERQLADKLASDLSKARAKLAGLTQRLADVREAAAAQQTDAAHMRRAQDEREAVFRHKLEELRRIVQEAGSQMR